MGLSPDHWFKTGEKHIIDTVYIQDPVMSSLDHAFVESKGFTVLEDPEAQNNATSTTLLFAIGFEWFTIEEIFKIAYPAVFLGGDLHHYIGCIKPCYTEETTQEEKEKEDRRVKEETHKTFQRMYKPFCDICLAQDIPLPGRDGGTKKMYYRRHTSTE